MATKRGADKGSSPAEKTRILETTSTMSNIIQQLQQQMPNNDLVKKLQGAFDEHLQQLTTLLDTVSKIESPEEKERKRSLVIIGLAESTDPKASERVKADNTATSEILDLLDVATLPVTTYRMGHPDPNRFPERPRKGPRVLKIVLPSSGIQRQVLSAIKNHRNDLKNSKYKRCIIRPSLSAEDREKDRAAHQELTRRKQAGETKLYIRNFKVYSADELFGDL